MWECSESGETELQIENSLDYNKHMSTFSIRYYKYTHTHTHKKNKYNTHVAFWDIQSRLKWALSFAIVSPSQPLKECVHILTINFVLSIIEFL